MKKRFASIILTVFLVLSMMPFAAFADNAIVCPACGGSVTKQERRLLTAHDDFYKCDKCGKWAWVNKLSSLSLFSVGDQQILDAADSSALINFSFNNGKLIPAEKAPSGIGRKDLPGYADDDGTPSVSSDGGIIWRPTWSDINYDKNNVFNFRHLNGYGRTGYLSELRDGNIQTSKFSYCDGTITFRAISNGISFDYDGTAEQSAYTSQFMHKNFTDYYICPIRGKYTQLKTLGLTYDTLGYKYYYSEYSSSTIYDVGVTISSYGICGTSSENWNFKSYKHSWHWYFPTFKIIPYSDSDKPTSQTNITINNNTWNGNIYVDNSNNLTYIYPQYTTINENNETVTNISTNPIIYNSETNQYYTYDTVTNNYYYITYETTPTPTPSPSPSPSSSPNPSPSETPDVTSSPTPDPDNPDATPTPNPDTPTPTPKPSGDSDSDNSGGSSWNPFKWLKDLLEDIIEGILKKIWSLLTSIFGFILWLLSQVAKLFPFIPAQAALALTAGAVIVTIIRIIKFITGR